MIGDCPTVEEESLRPLQLLKEDETGALTLHVEQLEEILQQDELRGRRLVVISVVGAFRKGKSFLLSIMLNYLRAQMRDEIWDENILHEGIRFPWRGGSERETRGVLVWPEIFKVKADLAVLLVDTQGIFDDETSLKQNSFIFTFATLLSSVQIFNVSHQIQLDDMMNLQLFLELGRMITQDSNVKPFQELIFLVRDWQHVTDFNFGFEGGQDMLTKKWLQSSDANPDKVSVCNTLTSCYNEVKCCLLPYPGNKVARGHDFKVENVDEEFKECLSSFIYQVLEVNNLTVKKIADLDILTENFANFIRHVFGNLQKDDVPQPMSMFECLAAPGYENADKCGVAAYESCMENACRDILDESQINLSHKEAQEKALHTFNECKTLGGESFAQKYRSRFEEYMIRRFQDYKQRNFERSEKVKREKQIEDEVKLATLQYVEEMSHESYLEQHHNEAKQVALNRFIIKLAALPKEELSSAIANLAEKLDVICVRVFQRIHQFEDDRQMMQVSQISDKYSRCSVLLLNMHEKFYGILGNRQYDIIDINDSRQILEKKVGFALLFEISENSEDIAQFSENKRQIISKICETIRRKSATTVNSRHRTTNVYFAAIFLLCVDLEFNLSPKLRTLFRIGDKNDSTTCCFIDDNPRVYKDWKDYKEANNLGKYWICSPENGVYKKSEQGIVAVEFEKSNACGIVKQAAGLATSVSSVVSTLSFGYMGAASIVSALPAVPLLGPAAAASAVGAVAFSLANSFRKIIDEREHQPHFNTTSPRYLPLLQIEEIRDVLLFFCHIYVAADVSLIEFNWKIIEILANEQTSSNESENQHNIVCNTLRECCNVDEVINHLTYQQIYALYLLILKH